MSDFWRDLGAALSPAVIGIAAWCAAKWTSRLKKKTAAMESIEDATKQDARINILLDRAMRATGAMRIYVCQYHNGDAFLGGTGIIRQSRTHEQAREGIMFSPGDYRGALASRLNEEGALVVEEGASWTVVRTMTDSPFKFLCENAGALSIARAAIRKKGRTVGFVGADFDHTQKPETIESLVEIAHQIEQVLHAGLQAE